jgi:outer membrane protein TolC
MKKKLRLLLIFIIAFKSGYTQDTLALSVHDALETAIKNNFEILLAKTNQKNAAAKFHQTNAAFLPHVNLSYTALATNNPLNAFGSKLQQQSVSAADFNPELLNNPSAVKNYFTKVELNQPLLNIDKLYQRKAAEQQIDIYYYKTERTKEYVMFEVQKAYAQLQLSHQAVSVLKESLRTVHSIFESSKNYHEKGFLQKSDLLLVQVQVATIESKLAEAKSNVLNTSDYMSLLMGTKSGAIYFADSLKIVEQPGNEENQVTDDRADIKALRSALNAQEKMIHSEKLSSLPRLNAFANYMVNDKTAFGFGSNSYLLGVQFSWDLFNGTTSYYRAAEQKITHTRLEQQLNYQKEQSQVELNKTVRQLADAQFALQQHEISVRQAEEALRILENRFRQGLTSTNDLLQSQSTLSEQKLFYSEAVFSYNTTLVYLQFLTSKSENK